ncbi:MAG TPA: glycosyltransferase [Vicinamibacterales bacterium]|nr:glycosyltransferase [Vicinamibacterales bacterium]
MAMTAHPQLKVAYVVREFPVVGDERLLDELLALEHSQVDLQVFSLNPSNGYRQPSKAARLHARIGYPPARSPAGHTSVAAATTAAGERRLPRSRPATRPEASWISGAVLDAGIQHLHAHSAGRCTEVAREVARMTGITYSFSVGASDLGPSGVSPSELREGTRGAQFVVTRNEASLGMFAGICGPTMLHKVYRMYDGIDLSCVPFHDDRERRDDALLVVAGPKGNDGIAELLVAVGRLAGQGRTLELTVLIAPGSEAGVRSEAACRGLNESVTVISAPSDSIMRDLLQTHTLLVAPWTASGPNGEIPCVLLQAMALGLPIIASDLPGFREAIADGWTGRLISAGDSIWLAGAMETLLENPRLRTRMARAARERVEREFSVDCNVTRLARLFERAATPQNPPFHVVPPRLRRAGTS